MNFTQQVAVDYADSGVRVNSICPGFVETPMDRHGQPDEIAPMASFLASDEASYITGTTIPIDGGWTAF